jgi:hypothetical protein
LEQLRRFEVRRAIAALLHIVRTGTLRVGGRFRLHCVWDGVGRAIRRSLLRSLQCGALFGSGRLCDRRGRLRLLLLGGVGRWSWSGL